MIIYKSNKAGPYHIEKGLPCQDSFAISKSGIFSILAVTDGLGSELHSDIGSAVAAKTAVEYCSEHITAEMQCDAIKKVMNNALVNAYKAVLTRASEDGNDSDDYDTTLCLAVYDGKYLYYAQSGDSGLVALLENGEYYRVTTQQRDEEGRVFPLCWGPEKWELGYVDFPVSAFMLMTDGVFEQICPKVMRRRNIEINIPLARKFLDRFDCTEEDIPKLEKAVHEYMENYPRHLLDDDKTVVVLINPNRIPAKKKESYYAIPDWKFMRDEAEKKLNSHRVYKPHNCDFIDAAPDANAEESESRPEGSATNDSGKLEDSSADETLKEITSKPSSVNQRKHLKRKSYLVPSSEPTVGSVKKSIFWTAFRLPDLTS